MQNRSEMVPNAKTIAFRVMALQTGMLVSSVMLLWAMFENWWLSVLIGWGAIVVANSIMFTSMTLTDRKPLLLILQIGRYSVFAAILYWSAIVFPKAWPNALWGILVGQLAHTLSCYIGGDC